ncbi:alpha,alpha-trehalase TreF [Bauldia sp.]|uniref:alpha,alpha-trehalase TreF n=1 Tax=Bauldia sp. TaxID=2575872 RepID=UPI003BAAE768
MTLPIDSENWPKPPSELLPGLFETVAMADIMPAKDWADAIPRLPVAEILNIYRTEAPEGSDALAGFVAAHFAVPPEVEETVNTNQGLPLRAHIEALWPVLTREASDQHVGGSLIPLPNRYIVPGGRFREVYYWDSFFTMLGLGQAEADIRRDMIENFAYLIRTFGFIPNANRSYYLSRSQPPFFFKMVELLERDDPVQAYRQYLDELKTEHAFWMAGATYLAPGEAARRVVRMDDGSLLNRYWDDRDTPRDESYRVDVETAAGARGRSASVVYRDIRAAAESGWDISSRWFSRRHRLVSVETVDIVPPDLNAVLFGLELAIASGCGAVGDNVGQQRFMTAAADRKAAISAHLWNGDVGAFTGYDLATHTVVAAPSAASLYPMYFGAANDAQVKATVHLVKRRLLAPGGLLATPNTTGQQWDKPNGWAPVHWIAIKGLAANGETTLAKAIAERWLRTVSDTYRATGKLVEKYNVISDAPGGGGEYPLQDGFGWTNGVTLALLDLYPELARYGDVRPQQTG